ncbi:3'-5' exonuclease [Gluconobacter oxydans]|uniref:3'-5' exonuclease n=1 Tax=Gluconobacter oxydans TaxID=442 RepID=UPI001378140F|nr:3'-5' exonuclease [Gluconobacter oxydans]
MTAKGPNQNCTVDPIFIGNVTSFVAITEHFLPKIEEMNIPLGDATILAKDWGSLISLARQLRDFRTPVVGPGARPYRRSRLFAGLAEQLCGAVTDPQPDSMYQLERTLFHAIQNITAHARFDVFSHAGRVVIIRLLRVAKTFADKFGALSWLDHMSKATGDILTESELLTNEQAGLFYASVQEMKADMHRQRIDINNLSIEDLGLFASPSKALRLSTIHYSKGREYGAVALIGLRQGSFPHFRATTPDAVAAEKRGGFEKPLGSELFCVIPFLRR